MHRGKSFRSTVLIVLFTLALPAVAGDLKTQTTTDQEPVTRSAEPVAPLVFRHAKMISIADLKSQDAATRAETMRAFIDPVTGALRAPNAEELKKIEKPITAQAASTAAPLTFTFPDGTVIEMVGPESLNYSVAAVSSNGISFSCVEGHDHTSVVAAGRGEE